MSIEMRWLIYFSWTVCIFSVTTAVRHRRHHNQQHTHQLQQQIQAPTSTQSLTATIGNELNKNVVSETLIDPLNSLHSWLATPELNVVHRVVNDCQSSDDFTGCLKQKALVALSRALDRDTIKIADGLVLEKQNHTEAESIVSTIADARTLSTLTALDRALIGKIDKLVRTHALKMDMSTGRDKKKKKEKKKGGGHIKYIVAALLTAMGIAGPIGLKALAAIAVKALVISKVALTIAGIIALKKLFAHEHHEETSFQVHAGDHNRRSTYVIRPVAKASPVPALSSTTGTVDPYRYYYEYHQ